MKTANTHGGGAQTNKNGLSFEQTTSLTETLEANGFKVDRNVILSLDDEFLGLTAGKYDFYRRFLSPKGIDYSTFNSKRWLPDEAFINEANKTVYIIEKKFQSTSGSVDEKLPGCAFKRREYLKLCRPLGYKVEYIYVFNDWFKRKEYADVLEYIEETGCYYFFNKIPLKFLGL